MVGLLAVSGETVKRGGRFPPQEQTPQVDVERFLRDFFAKSADAEAEAGAAERWLRKAPAEAVSACPAEVRGSKAESSFWGWRVFWEGRVDAPFMIKTRVSEGLVRANPADIRPLNS